jgi:Holliday junction DNA helicase RuvA
MIASLNGQIEVVNTNSVVVNVNGVGYLVYLPSNAVSIAGAPGDEIKLYTHLHVREDVLALYGFMTPEELKMFETLTTVSGIGPKLGLAMLSAMTVEQLTMAIAAGDANTLRQVPGIGKKTSERVVLELKDKIENEILTMPASRMTESNNDVIAALVSLGYSVSEAARAAASIPSDRDLSIQEKIKAALRYFGTR